MTLIAEFLRIVRSEPKSSRARLPDRRNSVLIPVIFEGIYGNRKYEVGFSPDKDGVIREVFCHAGKTGEEMQSMIHDGCISISRALQFGDRISDIASALGEMRNDDEQKRPASPFGAIARAGAKLEREFMGIT